MWREVSLWDAGKDGPSSFRLERAVGDHGQGIGEVNQAATRGQDYGISPVLPRLWRTPGTQCCRCLNPALSVTPFVIFPILLPLLFQTLHAHCCQKPPILAHFAWGKGKLQVHCQHSGVSKHSWCKKVFICACPSYSVLLNNTFLILFHTYRRIRDLSP